MSGAESVAAAFRAACRDELESPKPGNVHLFAPGHRMEAQDFLDSAEAAAPAIAAEDAGVGARILGAVEATQARVGQNTNLGILLLCAPLAHAALRFSGLPLREALERTLSGLTLEDARLAFRAIALASPAGLGSAAEHDVNAPARVTLLEAMRAAASRDRIAFQYANGFCDIFGQGLSELAAARAAGAEAWLATLRVYLRFFSAFPDSHILRKHGAEAALRARGEACDFVLKQGDWRDPERVRAEALAFDATLKVRGLNPGTSADLTVATLFAARLAHVPEKCVALTKSEGSPE
ncbi:triphosphoribosyl-dephospho-CoA synthase [Methylocystis bryophila]|uniref:Triphosphoribosyl-dephospho-CoA synthase n=1 Tax=Methylocystis bryophila TaxID=655015 RepID=A0A1W6MQY6_9HYPH|nr:triphosphoribosyl-dephospho-CoA synthase [Methylocystis bryophila]ARN79899.1 triphosphoribosyl-dephospho-CoA synthase [Methylocystis bryophila]BDV39791.1 triphosphoribosyl-dephospho-CoA synthase [Methylocystis bryophila]